MLNPDIACCENSVDHERQLIKIYTVFHSARKYILKLLGMVINWIKI